MKKGFIGPIGDDLPSIIAIVLALAIFFSSITFAFNIYNQKLENLNLLKGAIEVSRTLTVEGLMPQNAADIPLDKAKVVASSYGLDFEVFYDQGTGVSCTNPSSVVFNHVVATWDGDSDNIALENMYICIWR